MWSIHTLDKAINENTNTAHIISYDIPSGVEATSGKCYQPHVKAHTTLTLALPKKAAQTEEGKPPHGKIFLGDIGIPALLYNQVIQDSRPNFNQNGLIEI